MMSLPARISLSAAITGFFQATPLSQAPSVTPLRWELVETDTERVGALEFTPDDRLLYATQDGKLYLKEINFDEPWKSPPSRLLLTVKVAPPHPSADGVAQRSGFARDENCTSSAKVRHFESSAKRQWEPMLIGLV